jgi:hypothetical protein
LAGSTGRVSTLAHQRGVIAARVGNEIAGNRWEAERRAQRPLDVMHPIEITGGLVAAGLMLYWSLPYLF